MSPAAERPSREAVLDAFAVEGAPGRATLERYLRLYPEYASDLVDLSRELNREVCDDTAPLAVTDLALLDAAWARYAETLPVAPADPFAALTVDDWRAVANRLGLPRQVVTALRERRIALASIPRLFLGKLAKAVRSSVAELEETWGAAQMAARSYKAYGKPTLGGQPTFEKVLIDAGVSAEKRAEILADED